MERVLSIFLPNWSTDLIKRKLVRTQTPHLGEQPEPDINTGTNTIILLTATVSDQQFIKHCCPQALALGVKPDMTLAHARALLPYNSGLNRHPQQVNLHIESHDIKSDLAALHHFAVWATRFCPVVATDPTPWRSTNTRAGKHAADLFMPGLLMNITGCDRLYQGEQNLINQLTAAIKYLNITCRSAAAPTFGAAWAFARFSAHDQAAVSVDQLAIELRPLPLDALRLEADVIQGLAEIGIDCVGHVMDLPRHTLPSRFGDDLLLRLSQALGTAIETITPVRPVPPPCVELMFQGPTTHFESIEAAARQLLDQLIGELQQRESGARQLVLRLFHVILDKRTGTGLPPAANTDTGITLKFSQPTRQVKHIWSLLYPKLEKIHLRHGVEGLMITATHVGRLRHQQTAHWRHDEKATHAQTQQALGEMLDVLTNRLGPQRVQSVQLVGTHQPEHAFRYHHAAKAHHTSMINDNDAAATWLSADRPSVLFAKPEPMDAIAITPDGPPTLLRWRGQTRRIETSIGPLRIADPWWENNDIKNNNDSRTRDFFKVMDEAGCWLWVYRDINNQRWFVCGRWE